MKNFYCKPSAKEMIPAQAYRDEGTSYHYVPASDYITIKMRIVLETSCTKME